MIQFKRRQLKSDKPLSEQLKEVRRTAKLTFEQIAIETKIPKKYLRALEQGKYEELPAEVYVRGFLENYASYLGFPQDEVLTQYRRERGVSGRKAPSLDLPKRSVEQPKLTITPRTLGLVTASVLLLTVVGYLITQITGFASPPDLEITGPVADARVADDRVTVSGKTESDAQVFINNQPIPTDTDGSFKETVTLPAGTNSLRIVARDQNGRERIEIRSVVVTPGGPQSPQPKGTTASGALFVVKVGPNSAFVEINTDGKTAFDGLMAPGSTQTFTAKDRVLVTTSNGGSTTVTVNGKGQGTLGSEGQFREGVQFLVKDFVQSTPSPSPRPE
ncbi:MAG TPA: RodZ domain-containing protein [Patescibacteria group bacterium]